MLQITGIDLPSGLRQELVSGEALNVGGLVSRILTFAIILAGLYFFARLISAGYKYLTSAGESGKIQEATKELTGAAIGFVIVLVSFFLAQIIEVIFGISIL